MIIMHYHVNVCHAWQIQLFSCIIFYMFAMHDRMSVLHALSFKFLPCMTDLMIIMHYIVNVWGQSCTECMQAIKNQIKGWKNGGARWDFNKLNM